MSIRKTSLPADNPEADDVSPDCELVIPLAEARLEADNGHSPPPPSTGGDVAENSAASRRVRLVAPYGMPQHYRLPVKYRDTACHNTIDCRSSIVTEEGR
jgi:hypothetical protein